MIKDICLLVSTMCADRRNSHQYIILVFRREKKKEFEYIV
jgi:hypothetical protein